MTARGGDRVVKIGAATAFYNDSRMGIAQLLAKGGDLDYIIFDFLAESVMGGLGRGIATSTGQGFATDFVDGYILPHLQTLLDRGIRVVANAGGLAPTACAQALRDAAAAQGLSPRIGVVEGDDLTGRVGRIVGRDTRDMFDGGSIADRIADADRIDSLVAYTGAFPIAAALAAGADIVVTGRVVDSALALGPLIHEFGWGPDDFDLLAAGTLAGHLLECSAQVTGGTFTDWRDVPDWAGIGMPIGECRADGSLVVTKPDETGGLVSIGTVSEQLLYEVSDPQRYYVADVICDFTDVRLRHLAPDRVEVTGARGLGRTDTYKASLTWDEGWRATALIPVIGLEADEKAKRMGEALFARGDAMLRASQRPPFTRTRCDVIGGRGGPADPAICRLIADHPDRAGAELLAREQGSAISHMAVGTTMGMAASVRPVQRIAGFLLPKAFVMQHVTLDGAHVPFTAVTGGRDEASRAAPAPALPGLPDDIDPAFTVPLIRLAWARSGDKGNLFNVAVIAREPRFLPYVAAALTPEWVGAHYGGLIGNGTPLSVERFAVPGLSAINFVVADSMDGGVLASTAIDPIAKGMAQLLLDLPIAVSLDLHRHLHDIQNDRYLNAAKAESRYER
ncbi:acyclic terpene utilization AtuA family protein [uncultured Sphingomonas sp.]|uniref:acyclic terpene utilization AtuA family protein n=1 Tax=uncultured Sphingomonas sp. TaxID=158754 RepID=UPI00262BFA02|nr:acyclic terpene utilization AtuA family protein [uncultured Sphingomonas sp.]